MDKRDQIGKIKVTIDSEHGTNHEMKDLDYVLVLGGKKEKRHGHEGTDMSMALMGKLNFVDMVNILTCACKTHPGMRMALRAVYFKETNKELAKNLDKIMADALDNKEEKEEEDIAETDIDDLIKEIFDDKKEQ